MLGMQGTYHSYLIVLWIWSSLHHPIGVNVTMVSRGKLVRNKLLKNMSQR